MTCYGLGDILHTFLSSYHGDILHTLLQSYDYDFAPANIIV